MPEKTEFEFGGLEFIAKAYAPHVTVQNEIFPPYEELRNCRTCHYGRQLPSDKMDKEQYHYRCVWVDQKEHIGAQNLDNDCTDYIRIRKE